MLEKGSKFRLTKQQITDAYLAMVGKMYFVELPALLCERQTS